MIYSNKGGNRLPRECVYMFAHSYVRRLPQNQIVIVTTAPLDFPSVIEPNGSNSDNKRNHPVRLQSNCEPIYRCAVHNVSSWSARLKVILCVCVCVGTMTESRAKSQSGLSLFLSFLQYLCRSLAPIIYSKKHKDSITITPCMHLSFTISLSFYLSLYRHHYIPNEEPRWQS